MKRTTVSERALVLAPRGRDAALAVTMLAEAGCAAEPCGSLPDLIGELNRGAGLVVVTEEALATADLAPLAAWLADQQEWSDLSFVLLTNQGGGLERNPTARRYLDVLGNATFIERPFHPMTLVSLTRSALRGRRRQYEARSRLEALRGSEAALRELNETLEGRVTEEVAERAKAEDALRQAQKMEAIGQLTGGVAHDFNNLLTIIKASTDLLRRPGLAEERRRRYVDAISDTVDRAAKLTGQLLAFARRQALKPEVFDAAERLRAVTDMLSTVVGSRIEIAADIAAAHCYVEADVSQFETALVNMAVNARDAMDGQGTLTMQIESVTQIPPLRGHGGIEGRFVAVSLMDTGSGIPADKLAQIFEPFFTTKEVGKGTGLGLSQVYGFAKQSGGDVEVRSELGRGTVFKLYLPRIERPASADAPAETGQREALEHGRGRRVLVVEDNFEVGTFSTQILQDLGYETVRAANGDEALALLADSNGFDVVFSDVAMPGMSGIELGHEIRRLYPGLPVVLTSGYSHVLAEEGRHGFELLQKPYAAEDIARVLGRATRFGRSRVRSTTG